jgi:hypothetical protein
MSTLGEELISNERVALTELVKNAYDADASLVLIRLHPPRGGDHGSLEVWDNGHGMAPSTVRLPPLTGIGIRAANQVDVAYSERRASAGSPLPAWPEPPPSRLAVSASQK